MADFQVPVALPPPGFDTHDVAVDRTAGADTQQMMLVGPARSKYPFHALTPQAPVPVVVGAVNASALAAEPDRKGLICVNTSALWIFLAFGHNAVLHAGIALAPNGGTYNMEPWDFSTAEMFAIATGAGATLAVQEYVL